MDELQRFLKDGFEKLSRMSERVIIMVDRSNLEQSWRRVEPASRPDYLKIRDKLAEGRHLKQCRLYYSDIDSELVSDSERTDWQRRQDFYTFLRYNGWMLKGVRKKIYDGNVVEKGLDGALIRDLDTVCRENRCDTLILVAGDADYCDVITDVQERYCTKVEVAFFPNQTSRELQSKATKFINLECIKSEIGR